MVYIRFGKIQQHRYRSVSDALPGTRAEEDHEAEQPISDGLHENGEDKRYFCGQLDTRLYARLMECADVRTAETHVHGR